MNLENFEKMDPIILMSIINMKLRDEFSSLTELVKYFDIDKEKLQKKLADAGFEYQSAQNQFK